MTLFDPIMGPLDNLDFTFKLTDWMPAGDTIAAVVWNVPAGLTKGATSFTDTTATIWLSGGIDGANYEIECTITTTQGRIKVVTMPISIRDPQ